MHCECLLGIYIYWSFLHCWLSVLMITANGRNVCARVCSVPELIVLLQHCFFLPHYKRLLASFRYYDGILTREDIRTVRSGVLVAIVRDLRSGLIAYSIWPTYMQAKLAPRADSPLS